ncbi:MAG: RHS repeat-associated core domain-containing protein [Planctomycetota bacterium]
MSYGTGQLNQARDPDWRASASKRRPPRSGANWDSTTETRTHNSVNELTQRTVGQDPSVSLSYDDAGQHGLGAKRANGSRPRRGSPNCAAAQAGCDAAGAHNLVQDGDSDGDHKYVWDYRQPEPTRRRSARARPTALSEAKARSHAERNRLIEVKEKQSGAWTTIAEYRYDAKARRVLKDVSNKGDLNGTTRYVWGSMTLTPSGGVAWQCLEERDASGDLEARYTYAPGYIDAVAVQERDLNGDGDFGDSGEVVYYHSNTLYSVYALSNGSENVAERYRYNAYGACTVLDADWSADADGASDVSNAYAFTGRRLDVESGLMQYRHRYYSTNLGRFVSRDPAGYADWFNLYQAFQSLPTRYADPTGQGVVTVALSAYAAGKGVSNLILAGYYFAKCSECHARAREFGDRAARKWRGPPDGFARWLRKARPGAECATLCVKAGIHGFQGVTWVFCGVVIKYSMRYAGNPLTK